MSSFALASIFAPWMIPVPFALPLLIAAALAALTTIIPRRLADAVALATALITFVACALIWHHAAGNVFVYWFGGWVPRPWPPGGGAGQATIALGVSYSIDAVGAGIATLAAFLAVVALIFSWGYFESCGSLFHGLVLIFMAAMAGFGLTGDLFNLFVCFELMSVAAYALTGYKVEEEHALSAAINFAVVNSVGAYLIVLGIGLVYARTNALNLAQIGEALARGPCDALVVISLTLIAGGFLVKAAVVPFHFWLADAHAAAPSPVCLLFSGVMVEQGLYGAARVYWTCYSAALAPHAEIVRTMMLAAGAVTALVGGAMCLRQRHVKRLLAFSTISHVGILTMALATLGATGVAGAALYVLGHAGVKGAMFLASGVLLHRLGTMDIPKLHSRGRRLPVVAGAFVLGGLGLAGTPLLGLHAGSAVIEEALKDEAGHWAIAVSIVAAALTGGAVLAMAGRVFFGLGGTGGKPQPPTKDSPETEQGHDHTPATMKFALLLLGVTAVAVGAWPHLDEPARRAAAAFVDRPAYAAAVLHGTPLPAYPVAAETASELMSILLSVGGAVAVAALALFGRKLPRRATDALGAVGRPFVAALGALHSGQVGDYVTWLVVGFTLAGAVMLLATR